MIKNTKLKFYNAMPPPALGRITDKRKPQAAEMSFLWKVKGCTHFIE
jgi:hypothetical protein